MSKVPDVQDVNYRFTCRSCLVTVMATWPELIDHGWIDVSTHSKPNQWLCPACARGFTS